MMVDLSQPCTKFIKQCINIETDGTFTLTITGKIEMLDINYGAVAQIFAATLQAILNGYIGSNSMQHAETREEITLLNAQRKD